MKELDGLVSYSWEVFSMSDGMMKNLVGVGSRDNPVKNEDGSVTITIGQERPDGVPESNFIYSNANENWFTYFRTYAPTEAYFDKSWRLPDIGMVK